MVLATGGTIAGRASQPGDMLGYTAGQIGVEALLAPLAPHLGGDWGAEQVAQLDSKDMTPGVWWALAQRVAHWLAQPGVRGVVVTHGTDTLEETAYFLQALLQPAKPVVLACAMRPATALVPDGPQNLVDAMVVARTPGACGVLVVCQGLVHAAEAVQKLHTHRLDAFGSGDAGPVGQVRAGAWQAYRNWPLALADSGLFAIDSGALSNVPEPDWPRVELVDSHAGQSGAVVRALLATASGQGLGTGGGSVGPLRGLVVAGTGHGTLHQALEAALREAREAGVEVWRSTRCVLGTVLARPGDEWPASPLPPAKARVALMLALLARAA